MLFTTPRLNLDVQRTKKQTHACVVIKCMTELTLHCSEEMMDFSVRGSGYIGYSRFFLKKKKGFASYLTTYAKINAKCIIDFKIEIKKY